MLHVLCLCLVLFLFVTNPCLATTNNILVAKDNVTLNGIASLAPSGLLTLSNSTPNSIGRAFHARPFAFKTTPNGEASSFSTVFAFALVSVPGSIFTSDGMAFLISPAKDIPGAGSGKYLGLVNRTSDGNPSNHIIAVEFDIIQNPELGDINGNHVGIDLNRIESNSSTPAGFYEEGKFNNLTLASGKPILAWVDYDGVKKQLNVTLAPIDKPQKPNRPLLASKIDLSPYVLEEMYVGFSAATGGVVQACYVLGWSFQMNGEAQELDLSTFPRLPNWKKSKKKAELLAILLPILGSVLILLLILLIYYLLKRREKYAEVLEDWEVEYGPHRLSYKDLYKATKGFSEKELLGRGGFGQVYRGVLQNNLVAVKRISHDSTQGMKGFVAEIATIGRIRHPNLVRLLGYSRRKGELLLVYDYMPNGSLDKFIFGGNDSLLDWGKRFKIIKDVASGLTYLHEEWAEVIIHRDIKASNVVLDGELNGKLGDFGLARVSYTGDDLQTTQIAGTIGYIAPELAMNAKSNTKTDVFSFGVFCLEVACGRRPVELEAPSAEINLVEWVSECFKGGGILATADPKLGNVFRPDEMELVLKLGLLCTQLMPDVRPSMSVIKRYLNGDVSGLENLNDILMKVQNWKGLREFVTTYASTSRTSRGSVTISDIFTSVGR